MTALGIFSAVRKRKLRFTKEGKYFVALCLGIGFAAINTGNNLLYLVLGMMLAFIMGSGVLSDISLSSLQVTRQIPDRLFAGQLFLMKIGLANTKRYLPSFSIEVEDLLDERTHEKKCYFMKVPACRTQYTSYRDVFNRRGLYHFSGFKVGTKFPFSLFYKFRKITGPAEVIVFPAIHPLFLPLYHWVNRNADAGEQMMGRLDRQGDFHGLREYQNGDDPRSIHWRKSAVMGRLLIRLHEDQVGSHITIFFNNQQKQGTLTPVELERQEAAVSQAASFATHFINQGYRVRLMTRTASVAPGLGQAHLNQVLRTLALLEFTTATDPFPTPPAGLGETVVIDIPSAVIKCELQHMVTI